MNTAAIATHLKITESDIIEIQEWASVLWVRFVGGVRFVSKKIGAITMKKIIETHNPGEHIYAETRLALEILTGIEFPEYTLETIPNPIPFFPSETFYIVGDCRIPYMEVQKAKELVDWSRVKYVGNYIEMY